MAKSANSLYTPIRTQETYPSRAPAQPSFPILYRKIAIEHGARVGLRLIVREKFQTSETQRQHHPHFNIAHYFGSAIRINRVIENSCPAEAARGEKIQNFPPRTCMGVEIGGTSGEIITPPRRDTGSEEPLTRRLTVGTAPKVPARAAFTLQTP
jgi:hypothetical protein